MPRCLSDSELDRLIEEDVPFGDRTTHLLGIGARPGRIVFFTREPTTVIGPPEGRSTGEAP